ncbi:hypothetical protein V6Z12_A01G163600 [Gossypium hirsutum]
MKFLCWNCRGLGNIATVREQKQLLATYKPDIVFLSETKMSAKEFSRVQNRCRMQSGLAVNSEGRSGGLALIWEEGIDVTIQSLSKHHINSMVRLKNHNNILVTGFYGHANPNLRSNSWEMLERVGGLVREDWVVGGDFNAILNEAEKDGGQKRVRAHMEKFKDVLGNLALVDIKPIRGWFTWQTHSDHDAIIWDMWGSKPKEYPRDQRLCFRFEKCWAMDSEAKNLISSEWNWESTNYVNKLEKIQGVLGPWKRDRYGKMKNDMRKLENKVDRAIDSERRDDSAIILSEMRSRLSELYARGEIYWAQRSRYQWLRDGDRNTRYFHARAMGRLKKNTIEKLKNKDGTWVTNSKDINNVAKNYFWRLFRSNGQNVENHEMAYIQECVTT